MARQAREDVSYLALHDGHWRVSMGVPERVRGLLGSHLSKSLGTPSATIADRLKGPYVQAFKDMIRDADLALPMGGPKRSALHQAHQLRPFLAEIGNKAERARAIREVMSELPETLLRTDPGTSDAYRTWLTQLFRRIFTGEDTMIAAEAATYAAAEPRPTKEAKAIELAAMRLAYACARSGIDPVVSAVDEAAVEKFLGSHAELFGPHAGAEEDAERLAGYWEYLHEAGIASQRPFVESSGLGAGR